MNILRHKSWHVRNRNNITRVRNDEEKARNEEFEKDKRIALADSERRVHLLRQRLTGNESKADTSEISAPGTHLDIFKDFDDKVTTKNKEYEKEIKEETEKFEKKNGILNYLVDKDIDSEQNWYLDSHEKRMKLSDNKIEEKYTEKDLKDIKMKKFNDPFENMKRYLDLMKPKTDSKSDSKQKDNNKTNKSRSEESIKRYETPLRIKSKKNKKHKKNKKKKRKRNSSESSGSDDKEVKVMSKNLEQLRAERLERERIERERTRSLLSGKSGTQTETVIFDDRLRKYNSQFNPDIARQNAQIVDQ